MVKILAVYDADPAFGERLADYVNQKEKIPFTAMAFSSLDRLREYGKEHPIEILLVDECSRALVGDVKAEQVMVLCDGELVDGWMHLHPSTSTSPGTASCVRCWHPTAAALWSRRWPFWDPGPWLWEYILL